MAAADSRELKPCPFCGSKSVDIREGSTFRWRIVVCTGCEATCGEIRHDTMADDQVKAEVETHARAIAEWNARDEDKGEAVAWMRRNVTYKAHDGSNLTGRRDGERILSERKVYEDDIPLYTRPSTTSAEDARDAARYRWLRENEDDRNRVFQSSCFEDLDKAIDAVVSAERGK